MPPRLPQVSGNALVGLLLKLGYVQVRQRGSHIQLRKATDSGIHSITVPAHRTVAKGTLNDILSRVGVWNGLSRQDLLDRL